MFVKIFNFLIFIVTIGWVLKKFLKSHFAELHASIKDTFEKSQMKLKETDLMLAKCTEKMKNVDVEMDKIQKNSEQSFERFEIRYIDDVKNKIEKNKADAQGRLEAEKARMYHELGRELVDAVISKSKSDIRSNKNLQSKISNKLVEGVIK